jgi:hypothetical protein
VRVNDDVAWQAHQSSADRTWLEVLITPMSENNEGWGLPVRKKPNPQKKRNVVCLICPPLLAQPLYEPVSGEHRASYRYHDFFSTDGVSIRIDRPAVLDRTRMDRRTADCCIAMPISLNAFVASPDDNTPHHQQQDGPNEVLLILRMAQNGRTDGSRRRDHSQMPLAIGIAMQLSRIPRLQGHLSTVRTVRATFDMIHSFLAQCCA